MAIELKSNLIEEERKLSADATQIDEDILFDYGLLTVGLTLSITGRLINLRKSPSGIFSSVGKRVALVGDLLTGTALVKRGYDEARSWLNTVGQLNLETRIHEELNK